MSEAKVNFGASKITITGAATVADIEKAGAFDGIKIVENNQSETFQKKRLVISVSEWVVKKQTNARKCLGVKPESNNTKAQKGL